MSRIHIRAHGYNQVEAVGIISLFGFNVWDEYVASAEKK